MNKYNKPTGRKDKPTSLSITHAQYELAKSERLDLSKLVRDLLETHFSKAYSTKYSKLKQVLELENESLTRIDN